MKIVVGMSGGVDSSVTAWLLKQQGHDVVGVFMRNWEGDVECRAREDFVDAAAVADVIGIELEAVNFAQEYQDRVFSYFLTEYQAGRTPNPDILCNSEIKFKAFLDHALTLGADCIATGHYAQVRHESAGSTLWMGLDESKDQSYFLYRLQQHQLKPALFPLGELLKKEVREIARQASIPTAEKKDSTGICFIGERPFREFLEHYIPKTPGPILTPEGRHLGTHQGLSFYTIGQRQGIGIGGPGEPWFVAHKDMVENTLYVVQGHQHAALWSFKIDVSDWSWISGRQPEDLYTQTFLAKCRYRQIASPCRILPGPDKNRTLVEFTEPQWAITPGQSLVLYRDRQCLGGSIIHSRTQTGAVV